MSEARKSERVFRLMILFMFVLAVSFIQRKKTSTTPPSPTPPPSSSNFAVVTQTINSISFTSTQTLYGVNASPLIRISFSDKVDRNTASSAISYYNKSQNSSNVPFTILYQNNDSTIVITPSNNITYLNEYIFSTSTLLKSVSGKALSGRVDLDFITQFDPSDKFPRISDPALLDLIQQQTFKYFWDYGHPLSGLARERSNATPETVTSGGSGFGVMAMVAAVSRGFITRSQAVTRLQTIISFLKNTAPKFHGAFSHWMNGTTGAVVPFGPNDDGADLVETSYLMMGLLTARQFFNGADPAETALRTDINVLWNGVEWDRFRQNGKKVLYW